MQNPASLREDASGAAVQQVEEVSTEERLPPCEGQCQFAESVGLTNPSCALSGCLWVETFGGEPHG